MSLHAQIICIGGNGVVAVLFVLAGLAGFQEGGFGLSLFLFAMAGAAGYTIWVLLKFRQYLGEEEKLEREIRLEQLRGSLEDARADAPDEAR
ncbi:MAG: hypothetical protein SGJ21_13210 [Alphaproteobacteria bacterium]|nr:hypothetical protein [Alphaproteobacteria bacterium]